MLTTPNYGLKKPEGTDVVNIDDLNGNADIIDTKLKEINTALPLKAPLDSPTFTGTPSAPTATVGTNTTQVATTAFINNLLASIGSTLTFTNSALTFRGINGTMADSDQWRVGGAGTASNSGYMEIATADDGTEPIYARQYTGLFASVARTFTLLDANGDTSIPNNVTVGASNGAFILASNGCPVSPNRAYGAIGQWFDGVAVQGKANAGATSNYIFSVMSNDQTRYLNVFNGGLINTKNNTLDDGSGNVSFAGSLTTTNANITSNSDAIVQIETNASATTKFRRKQIFSSNNVGGGNTWLFRATRPSDGAIIDYQLGEDGTEPINQAHKICTTANEGSSKVGGSANGYKRFADGTMIQWGISTITANTNKALVFPVAFPYQCSVVLTTPNNSGGGTTIGVWDLTKTQCTMVSSTSQSLYWIATGY